MPKSGGEGRLGPQRHFDQWALLDHRLEVFAAPVARDVREDLPPLCLVFDDACSGGQVGADFALEMKRHVRISIQVGEPAPASRKGNPADVDPPIDVVRNDLELSRLAGLTAGRCDVHGVYALKGRVDLFFGRCHISECYQSDVVCIPLRTSARDRRCPPFGSKFSGASHASNAARTAGHSPSMIENQAVSRLRPFTTMCCRNTPSYVNPNLSAARRDGSFNES